MIHAPMGLALVALLVGAALSAPPAARPVAGDRRMVEYRPERCAYCQQDTWCELRANGKWQCRGCKVVAYFGRFLYPPIGYKLLGWTEKILRDLYGTVLPESGLRRYRRAYISVGKQNGKPLSLETKIATIAAWKRMGDIEVGDSVLDPNWEPCRVVAVGPVETGLPCYEMRFRHRHPIVAAAEHEWMTRSGIRTTREIAAGPIHEVTAGGARIWRIDSVLPVPSVPVRCIQVDSPSHLFLVGESMIPTHNSFLTGGLPIYHLDAEDELDPEVYGAAAAKDQAGIVFKATAKLIRANFHLVQKYKVLDSVKKIVRRDKQPGTYEVLSADGDVRDGVRGSLLIRDEIHRWKTVKAETLADVLTKGQISRREPLDIQVTTAGAEYESPLWWNEYQFAKLVQADPSIAPDYYVFIREADQKRIEEEKDYWKSREARIAANPSHEDLGGHLLDAGLVAEMNKAEQQPAERDKYLRYNLNVPRQTHENPVIDIPKWQKCGGGVDLRTWKEFDLERLLSEWGLAGQECFAGVDASWTTDLTALVFVFPPFEGSDEIDPEQALLLDPEAPIDAESEPPARERWTLLPFFWMPEERVPYLERICRMPFTSWIERGFLQKTGGGAIDLRAVIERIQWGRERFQLREVPYDRMNFRAEALRLIDDGIEAVEVQQNFSLLSAPTKFLLSAYGERQLRHGNHPVLNWMAACLQLQYDNKDNCQPSKPQRLKSSKRIDGLQATVTALARALVAPRGSSVYGERDMRFL